MTTGICPQEHNSGMRHLLLGVLAVALLSIPVCAQDGGDRSDLAVVGRIKTEAFENSQVMDTRSI